jgi:dethiobiotin synthetase
MAGEEIEPARLLETARAAAAGADALVCEGVGGLLVPLVGGVGSLRRKGVGRPYLVRDLALDLGYPLVVAAAPGLGTINHTLLTLEVASAAGLHVAMVVLTPWPDEPTAVELSNRRTIASLGQVEVQTLPPLDLGTPSSWPDLSWQG